MKYMAVAVVRQNEWNESVVFGGVDGGCCLNLEKVAERMSEAVACARRPTRLARVRMSVVNASLAGNRVD